MIITTPLSDEEKEAVRGQYRRYFEIKRDFPHYVNGGALQEGMILLTDLFGEELFADIESFNSK